MINGQEPLPNYYVVGGEPGCCGVPREAPCAVSGARGFCIFGLIVHVLALMVGFFIIWQWFASILAFVACGVLLCCYNQCAYVATAILSIFGLIFDVLSLLTWISIYASPAAAGAAYASGMSAHILWFGLPSVLSTLSLVFVIIFGFSSLCCWKDATIGAVVSAPVVQVQAPSQAIHSTHHPQTKAELGEMPPPPAYGQ